MAERLYRNMIMRYLLRILQAIVELILALLQLLFPEEKGRQSGLVFDGEGAWFGVRPGEGQWYFSKDERTIQ